MNVNMVFKKNPQALILRMKLSNKYNRSLNVMFQKNTHHVKQGMTVLRIGTEIFGDLIFEKIMQTNMHLKVRKKFPIQPTIFR